MQTDFSMATDGSVDAGTDGVTDTSAEGSTAEAPLDYGTAKGYDAEIPSASEGTDVAQTEPGGDELYTVKVGGEERQVTLDELRSGFMMQADYTRKTQELAQERQRLQQAAALVSAIETDPAATIQALADAYQLNLGPEQAVSQGQEGEDGYVDPVEQRIASLERQLQDTVQQQQMEAAQRQINHELSELRKTYGDFDQTELVQHALNKRVDLITAYRDLHFDKVARREEATEQKRQAQMVASGAGTQRGVVQKPPQRPKSAREAVVMALRQAGVEV